MVHDVVQHATTRNLPKSSTSTHKVIPVSAVRAQDVSLPVLLDGRLAHGAGGGRVGSNLVAVVGVVVVAAVGPLEPEPDGGGEVPHRPAHHHDVEEGEQEPDAHHGLEEFAFYTFVGLLNYPAFD